MADMSFATRTVKEHPKGKDPKATKQLEVAVEIGSIEVFSQVVDVYGTSQAAINDAHDKVIRLFAESLKATLVHVLGD